MYEADKEPEVEAVPEVEEVPEVPEVEVPEVPEVEVPEVEVSVKKKRKPKASLDTTSEWLRKTLSRNLVPVEDVFRKAKEKGYSENRIRSVFSQIGATKVENSKGQECWKL